MFGLLLFLFLFDIPATFPLHPKSIERVQYNDNISSDVCEEIGSWQTRSFMQSCSPVANLAYVNIFVSVLHLSTAMSSSGK